MWDNTEGEIKRKGEQTHYCWGTRDGTEVSIKTDALKRGWKLKMTDALNENSTKTSHQ